MATRIDVMRHGEPVGGRRYRGNQVDDPLSELGWQQMWEAIPEPPPWEHIVTSPLSRCSEFGQALAERYGLTSETLDDLKEIGFGVWEGRTPDEITREDEDALSRFLKDPVRFRPEGAEPLEDFSGRVWEAYLDIAERHREKHVLIIAHAGVARAITANILGLSLEQVYSRLRFEYAAIIRSSIDRESASKIIIE